MNNTRFNHAVLFVLLWAAVLVFSGCAVPGATLKQNVVQEYIPLITDSTIQSKDNIEISVRMFTMAERYQYPQYFRYQPSLLPEPYASYDRNGGGERYLFYGPDFKMGIVAARVKITNHTEHILRMKDSRIYLMVPGENPVAALGDIGALDDIFSKIENDFVARQQASLPMISLSSHIYPAGLYSAILKQKRSEYRLINDLSAEILPNFSLEGLLVFPVTIGSPELTVSFFDIVTKTDQAGNPIKKTQFDFKYALRANNYWLDNQSDQWKLGTPPPQK